MKNVVGRWKAYLFIAAILYMQIEMSFLGPKNKNKFTK
jgi:hypothetical protein